MSKKGRPSKAEVFYVTQNRDKPIHQVAEDLDRSEAFVVGILDKNPVAEDTKKGFTAMTEGASELGDEVKKNLKPPYRDDCIYKPKTANT